MVVLGLLFSGGPQITALQTPYHHAILVSQFKYIQRYKINFTKYVLDFTYDYEYKFIYLFFLFSRFISLVIVLQLLYNICYIILQYYMK